MGSISFPKRLLLDPGHSVSTSLRSEPAPDCDGANCLGAEGAYDGPHWHFVESGVDPVAGPRVYPID
jgi:hypothetical protein